MSFVLTDIVWKVDSLEYFHNVGYTPIKLDSEETIRALCKTAIPLTMDSDGYVRIIFVHFNSSGMKVELYRERELRSRQGDGPITGLKILSLVKEFYEEKVFLDEVKYELKHDPKKLERTLEVLTDDTNKDKIPTILDVWMATSVGPLYFRGLKYLQNGLYMML